MPEGLEAEIWRRASMALVGRVISSVWFDERVAPGDLGDLARGSKVLDARRRGKVLMIDTDSVIIGLHFGMTGRLEIDGRAPIEQLEYASGADRPEWDRLRLATPEHSVALRMNDPRRLGRVSIDPDLAHLGPDVFDVGVEELARVLRRRRAPVKTVLLDQGAVAGLGNLCADEVLFDAGIRPDRRADDLSNEEVEALVASCRRCLPAMLEAGGSTHGVLSPAVRSECPPCPLDGGELVRSSIGSRTAVWCRRHQQ